MSDGDKYCEENCNRKGDRGWWIREWDGLALSSIGWLDKTSLMWWQLKEVKEGSMGTSEHSKKREQWAWRLWSGNIYGASSSSREARVVRTEVKGRQVGDEDKGNRVGRQIICNSKLSAWSPDPPSMFFHFLFSEFFPLSLLSPDIQKETLYMCCPLKAIQCSAYVQILELGYVRSNPLSCIFGQVPQPFCVLLSSSEE